MGIENIILAAAKAVGVSPSLLLAICTHESGLKNTYVHNDGGSPSIGICQIKYNTARLMGYNGQEKDLLDPKINALYAAKYLKWQKQRYGGNYMKATAAYNAGTFNKSNKTKGCPRNLKYLKKVKEKLPFHLKDKLLCEKSYIEEYKLKETVIGRFVEYQFSKFNKDITYQSLRSSAKSGICPIKSKFNL